jgi:hypothetical protein
MLEKHVEVYQPDQAHKAESTRGDRSIQIFLWTLWTLAVVGTAIFHWRADVIAQRPVNLLGMIIYTILTGVVGLLIMTLIEQWFEPYRFLD